MSDQQSKAASRWHSSLFECTEGLTVSCIKLCSSPNPRTLNVTLYGNRVFANVIKMLSYWIRVGPKSNYRCPNKRKESEI